MTRSAYIVFAAALFTATAACVAQNLTLSLNVSARPNPYLSEWETRRETAILTVTNLTGSPVAARLHARVLLDGTLKAETKVDKMPDLQIPPGVSNYFADEIVPNAAVKFYDNVDKTARRTGMLPAGAYELCVELVDEAGKPLSQAVCKFFFVTSYQIPVLLQPAADASIACERRPIFRWTPVVPTLPDGVVYRVLLFEVLPGQYPMQAFRANHPIMDVEVPMQTQLIWPADVPLPDGTMRYVWSVQALTMNRDPVGERDGFSEPAAFMCDGSVRPGEGLDIKDDGSAESKHIPRGHITVRKAGGDPKPASQELPAVQKETVPAPK